MPKSNRTTIRIILVVLFALLWVAFAPRQVGGDTTHLILFGNSMEPKFHEGDLVFVRVSKTYETGDIIAYFNPDLGHFVMHRIISGENGKFILQGDNNEWVDTYQPSLNEIIGKFWLQFPKVGKVINFLRTPLVIALLLGGCVFFLFLGIIYGKEDNVNAEPTPSIRNSKWLQTFFTIAVIVFMVSVFLFVIAFVKPAQIENYEEYIVNQEAAFSYTGTAPEGIYDQPLLSTGQPIFPAVTCEVDLMFEYAIGGEEVNDLTGDYSLAMRIYNNRSGLSRSQSLVPVTTFTGQTVNIAHTVNFCEVAETINEIEEKTGASSSSYSLEILPVINISGKTNQISFFTEFAPVLSFEYDHLQFSLNPATNLASVLAPSESFNVDEKVFVPNNVAFFSLLIPVKTLRYISSIFMGLSLAALVWGFSKVGQLQKENPILAQQMIQGIEIFDVTGTPTVYAGNTLHIHDFAELAKLAAIHRKVIFRAESITERFYYFEYEGTRYQFVEEELVDRAR